MCNIILSTGTGIGTGTVLFSRSISTGTSISLVPQCLSCTGILPVPYTDRIRYRIPFDERPTESIRILYPHAILAFLQRNHRAKSAPYHFLEFLNPGPPPVGEGRKTASEVRPACPRRVGAAGATAPDVQRVLTEDYYCCTSILV